jgi:anti-anti-sigma factor
MAKQSSKRRLEVEETGAVAVVHFRDSHIRDQPVIRDISRELSDLLEHDHVCLVLDFARVEYLSSGFVGPLVQLRDRAQAAGTEMAVVGLRSELAEVFALAGLDQELVVYADRQQALASVVKAHSWEEG